MQVVATGRQTLKQLIVQTQSDLEAFGKFIQMKLSKKFKATKDAFKLNVLGQLI